MIHVPSHPDAETRVISAIMREPERLSSAPDLEVADFGLARYRLVFEAIRNAEQRVPRGDSQAFRIAVWDAIKARSYLDERSPEFLAICRAIAEAPAVSSVVFEADVGTLHMARLAREQMRAQVESAE